MNILDHIEHATHGVVFLLTGVQAGESVSKTAVGQFGTGGITLGVGAAFGIVMGTIDKRLGWDLGTDFWGAALLLGCAGFGMLPLFIIRIRSAFRGQIYVESGKEGATVQTGGES